MNHFQQQGYTTGNGGIFIKNYFKGWYFKCASPENSIAFIPALHKTDGRQTASLQVITDTQAICIPYPEIKMDKEKFLIEIGDCVFDKTGIVLQVDTPEAEMHGSLSFGDWAPIRYDIMGPFCLIPFLQCRHSVYSMRHTVNGQVSINGKTVCFQNGIGYTEGDSGFSFPSQYIWTQCCFPDGSIMLSAADIPFIGGHFTGIIGVVMIGQKEYRLATYLGAKIEKAANGTVEVTQGRLHLTAKLLEENRLPLAAPERGKMSRTIHESVCCKAYYRFTCDGKVLCSFVSDRASFEYEGDVKKV